jgi:hypothetical protein
MAEGTSEVVIGDEGIERCLCEPQEMRDDCGGQQVCGGLEV